MKRLFLGTALWGLLAALGPIPAAWAASINDVFLLLPNEECGGLTQVERQAMLQTALTAPGAGGQTSIPDPSRPWLHLVSANYLILGRPGYQGDITYKLFDGDGFQLLAVCRGRQSAAPMDPVCRFDLCLYRLDPTGLSRADQGDYLPPVSILDFITPDTLKDPRAVRDIAARASTYNGCLTCNASLNAQGALDIITVTTVNAAACNNFLPPFGLLPLTWTGLGFTKPYDRAAPREGAAYPDQYY